MTDYSVTSRLLHQLVLGSPIRAEILHDLERVLYLKTAPPFESERHVFVTGLARAGTTVLMRELHATGAFGSLTYADMPFVLAPNLWAKLRSGPSRPGALRERAHGDGIKVNADSPEALDEVYWRLISGADYIKEQGLRRHDPRTSAIEAYADLARLVLRRTGKARYLSKNNNTLLRMAGLADAWPFAVFLVPLRDPLQHALSMLRQHRNFLQADAFTRKYMAWLAHHEFGATHRPYLYDPPPAGDPNTLDYWITVWIGAYRHVAQVAETRDNIVVLPYEDLCRDRKVWGAVLRRLGLDDRMPSEIREVAPREVPDHDPGLASQAQELHQALHGAAHAKLMG